MHLGRTAVRADHARNVNDALRTRLVSVKTLVGVWDPGLKKGERNSAAPRFRRHRSCSFTRRGCVCSRQNDSSDRGENDGRSDS
jgi:hypothetical protein